jgi:hypothetical protein
MAVKTAQMQNVEFVETDFTGPTDLIVVWYSATNNELSSNSKFLFRDIACSQCQSYMRNWV